MKNKKISLVMLLATASISLYGMHENTKSMETNTTRSGSPQEQTNFPDWLLGEDTNSDETRDFQKNAEITDNLQPSRTNNASVQATAKSNNQSQPTMYGRAKSIASSIGNGATSAFNAPGKALNYVSNGAINTRFITGNDQNGVSLYNAPGRMVNYVSGGRINQKFITGNNIDDDQIGVSLYNAPGKIAKALGSNPYLISSKPTQDQKDNFVPQTGNYPDETTSPGLTTRFDAQNNKMIYLNGEPIKYIPASSTPAQKNSASVKSTARAQSKADKLRYLEGRGPKRQGSAISTLAATSSASAPAKQHELVPNYVV